MSLIGQVVEAVQACNGVINLADLSRQLNIQPAALREILDFCAHKGILIVDKTVAPDNMFGCPKSGVCDGCSLSSECGRC